MATIQLNLKGKFKFPIAYSVAAESWATIFSQANGDGSTVTFFVLEVDMTDSAQRTNLFDLIKAAISAQYDDVVFLTDSFTWGVEVVGLNSYNVLTIDIEATATDPHLVGALFFAPEYSFTGAGAGSPNLTYGIVMIPPTCPELPLSNPLPGCQECFDAVVDECNDVILLLDFDPSTTYQVMLEDWTGTQNLIEKTSDSMGGITISEDDFEPGTNIEPSKPIKVTIYKMDSTIYTFAIGNTAYTCVNLQFKYGASITVPDPLIGTASQA